MKRRETRPATITMEKGFCVSEPMPVERAAGSRPRQATRAVIIMGRRRIRAASRVAVRISRPSCRNLLMKDTRITAVSTETPISASKPSTEDTLNGVCVSLSAISAPTGSVITTPSAIAKGNLKFPYSANRIMKIRSSASGPMTTIWLSASRSSLYSPPQVSW